MTWQLSIKFEWPDGSDMTAAAFERLIRECVDPLHRDNLVVYGLALVQVPENV